MKRIVFFLSSMGAFEVLLPIAQALSKAQRVPVVLLVSKKLRKKKNLSEATFSGLNAEIVYYIPQLMKGLFYPYVQYFNYRYLKDDDLIVGIEAYTRQALKKYRGFLNLLSTPIATVLKKTQRDYVFVQHGVVQAGINLSVGAVKGFPASGVGCDLIERAALCVLFNASGLSKNDPTLCDFSNKNICITGYLKAPYRVNPKAVCFNKMGAHFKERVLVCHAFGIDSRFSLAMQEVFYSQLKGIAAEYPDRQFIVRPHRGRFYQMDSRIITDNLIVAWADQGAFKGVETPALLKHVHRVISSPSSILMDACYFDIPIAVYANHFDVFELLPQVDSYKAFNEFMITPISTLQEHSRALKSCYGEDLSSNIERAASAIQDYARAS